MIFPSMVIRGPIICLPLNILAFGDVSVFERIFGRFHLQYFGLISDSERH